jgi:nucleoside-diphosphate-sugar epimerase
MMDVVANFIIHLGRDITVYGDGQQTRSFCYVEDLVYGMIRLMDSPDDVIGLINIGNPAELTIRELAEIVIDVRGSRSEIVSRPLTSASASPTSPRHAIYLTGRHERRSRKDWCAPSPTSRSCSRKRGCAPSLASDDVGRRAQWRVAV